MNIRSIKYVVSGGDKPLGLVTSLATAVLIIGFATALSACHFHGSAHAKACANGHCVEASAAVSATAAASDKPIEVMEISGFYFAFTTQGVVMTDGNYTGTVAIYDSNNNLVASTSVPYYVSGNEAHLSSPTQTETWVQNHFESGDTVKPSGDFPYTVTNPNAAQGTVTVNAYANSQSIASATTTVPTRVSHGGCGGAIRRCPPQKPNAN